MFGRHDMTAAGATLAGWLREFLPPGLVRAGLPPRRVRVMTVDALPLDPASLVATGRARDGRPIDIELARSVFLRKTVSLPAAARRDAEGAIAMQMRQGLPAGAQGLVWRSRPLGVSDGRANYEVLVLKQDSLTQLLAACPDEPRRVVIADGDGFAPLIDNRVRVDRPQWFWNRAAAAAGAFALIATLGVQAWRLVQIDAAERSLAAEVTALGEQAVAARELAEARGSAQAARMRDIARLISESRRLAELADVSEALDADVWLSSVEVTERTWRLVGFSRSDVSSVIAALQALPWVASVTPQGSIVLDPMTGEGRFQLVVEAVDPAGLE